jgi:hypothetical protein
MLVGFCLWLSGYEVKVRAFWGRVGNCGFRVGFSWLCKLFRKSVIVKMGNISEIRIAVGLDLGFGD